MNINPKENLIIIPARGGSKGIPNKNMYPLKGHPLIYYTIKAAIDSQCASTIAVSTDSENILNYVQNFDVCTILRPTEIAQDVTPMEPVITHVLDHFQKLGDKFLNIILLQPTSPLRKATTIRSMLSSFQMLDETFDAMITLTAFSSDLWVAGDDNTVTRLFPEQPRRRQDRRPLFVENSCIYISKEISFRRSSSLIGSKTAQFTINGEEALDINEITDFKLAEFMIAQ